MANRIVKLLLNERGECQRKLEEHELKEIMNANGVPFFPNVYDAPHDIWDVVEEEEKRYPDPKDKNRFSAADVRKFQQLTRKKNLNKKNMIVVNKDKLAKAADFLEIGEICGIGNVKEMQRFVSKLKRLHLIADSHNDKLKRTEYYVNPCYRKPGARLSVELYGLFREYLYEAMTVKTLYVHGIEGKAVLSERDITTNTYRNMIEQAYQQQRNTTSKEEGGMQFVEEMRVLVATDKIALGEHPDNDFVEVAKSRIEARRRVDVYLKATPGFELTIPISEVTYEIANEIDYALQKAFARPAIALEKTKYLRLKDADQQ